MVHLLKLLLLPCQLICLVVEELLSLIRSLLSPRNSSGTLSHLSYLVSVCGVGFRLFLDRFKVFFLYRYYTKRQLRAGGVYLVYAGLEFSQRLDLCDNGFFLLLNLAYHLVSYFLVFLDRQAPSGFSLGFDLKPHISTDFAKNRPFILFPELRGIVLSALFLWLVAHLLHCFVQGVPGLKPSCISLGYWDIVEVQMGACFVHMDISPYELQIRVSFLEALYILHKGFFGSLPHLWLLEVLFTAPLHHILIEQLFAVLRLLDVVAVVLYLSVSSFLLCVVLLQSFTEDFLIGLLYILIDQSDVLRAFGDINVVWDRLTYLLIFSSVMELATFTLWH